MPQTVSLTLPWPPSSNTYWRRNGARYFVDRPGHQYIDAVTLLVRTLRLPRLEGRLSLSVVAIPPDRRRRDLSNILKCLEDSLMKAGLFEDDSQIDELHVTRVNLEGDRKGTVEVTVSERG